MEHQAGVDKLNIQRLEGSSANSTQIQAEFDRMRNSYAELQTELQNLQRYFFFKKLVFKNHLIWLFKYE
jgi:hypothetical protein